MSPAALPPSPLPPEAPPGRLVLTRLRLENVRAFRTPLEVAGLQPGLNLLCGPNESGKSTLVRAIRAAFLDRYRSAGVADLQPWDDAAASPEVEVAFEWQGTSHLLRKRFLQRKRCELLLGDRRLENDEAEAWLARWLGFELAAKGASRAEHWGVPGLLWIEQGTGHEVQSAVGHAGEHLRQALGDALGEVASSEGDDVREAVLAERDVLLTRAQGKPTGPLLQAQQALAAAGERLETLQARAAAYAQAVDRLAGLRATVAAGERDTPWAALEARAAQAQARLAEVGALHERAEQDRATLRGVESELALLQAQAADDRALAEDAAARQAAAAAAEAARAEADAAATAAAARLGAALEARGAAQAAAAGAGQAALRGALAAQVDEHVARAARLAQALGQARELAARLAQARAAQAQAALTEADLAPLRRAEDAWREARIRQDAVATQLRFELQPGQSARLDGEPVEGQGERRLVRPATLEIAGVGRVVVTPGGEDLHVLAARTDDLAARLRAALQRHGVDSLSAAQDRVAQARAAGHEAQATDSLLRQLAPQGVAALEGELAACEARGRALQAQRAALPAAAVPTPAATDGPEADLFSEPGPAAETGSGLRPDLSLAAAEEALARATAACEAAQRAAQEAQVARQVAVSRRDQAVLEHDRVAARLADPARAARLADQAARHDAAVLRRDALREGLAARERQAAAFDAVALQQDVVRLRHSAENARQAHQQAHLALATLSATLADAGAAGLDEALATACAEHERAARHHAELARRAAALSLLLETLEAHRAALTQRLQAPLQRRLDHYLARLFPGARVQLDDTLAPVRLLRGAGHGGTAAAGGSFAALSHGAREQMALVSRLAYADLLQAAGRPTLLILDDALVHSDAERRDRLKRVLYDAATRHQILLLTCHPEAWQDLGVAARTLAAAPVAGAPGQTDLLADLAALAPALP